MKQTVVRRVEINPDFLRPSTRPKHLADSLKGIEVNRTTLSAANYERLSND